MKTQTVLLSFFACLFLVRSSAASPELIPLSAKDLTSKTLHDGPRLSVVNLWATWCEPCKSEMPDLVRFRKTYGPKGVQLVLISADSAEDLQAAGRFLSSQGVDFPVYRLAEPPDAFMSQLKPDWPAIVPTTMLFDRSGHRLSDWLGRVPLKALEARVDRELAGASLASKPEIGSHGKKPSRSTKSGDK